MLPSATRAIAATFLAASAFAGAQLPAERLTGQIEGVQGNELRINTASGQAVALRLADNALITVREPAKLDAIKPGVFIGTTAVAQADGTLSASEVHVFPESMRGVGEGHRPMERAPGSTMTNATVTSVAPSRNTMTNATVSSVAGTSGARRITLAYKGGEKTVVVGASTVITAMESGDRSALTHGAPVAVNASRQSEGSLSADRITVGRNGYVPN
jgi:hypothetical protein